MQTDKIQHIIWDWNGTLLDDTLACVNVINHLLTTRGVPPIDMPHYREVFGFPVIDFYRRINFPLQHEDWDTLAREFHDLFLRDPAMRLHTDALDALDHLRRRRLPQSILSASEQGLLNRMLTDFGIRAYFTEVYGAGDFHGTSKLDLGRSLLRRLDLPPENALLIGDTLHDAEVAHALGIPCALIAQGHQSAPRLAQTGAPIFATLTDLITHLGQPT